jgi:rifampicin phosphotransferase
LTLAQARYLYLPVASHGSSLIITRPFTRSGGKVGRKDEHMMNDGAAAAHTRRPFALSLGEVRRGDVAIAGGKGANLGELIGAGFPVPDGFVVTTAAYDRCVNHNDLGETIARALGTEWSHGAAIRGAFEGASIPPEVERSILAAYDQIGQCPVAVRSSATAEDLPEAAFAGQQDTFLNIIGEQPVLNAVRCCWASLWTDRAIAYRERRKIDQLTVKLAVVVQRLIGAEVAGVMFTANPVTGVRNEISIGASPGLGEAVVSGLVTPDHFALRRRWWGWRIVERRAGQREVIIQALAGGGTEHITGSAPAEGPVLPDRALRQLARLGAAAQRHFGSPQDVEWAWADDKLFILQARPITALPDPPPKAKMAHRLIANNFVEMLPIRPYPLDLDTWLSALGSAVEPLFALLGLDWSLSGLFDEKDGIVLRYSARLPRLTWKTLLAPARLVRLILRYNPIHWQSDTLLAETIARTRELESRDLGAISWEQLLAVVEAAKEIAFFSGGEIRRRYLPRAAFSVARLRILLLLLGQAHQFGSLLSGADNKTLEMNRALEQLARSVRADPNLAGIFAAHSAEALWSALEEQPAGRTFLVEFAAFLDCYGHRETVISTALQPTWKDAPAVALGIIKSFSVYPPPLPAGEPAWKVVRDKVLQHPLLRFAPLRSVFLEILAEARTLLQIREDTHFYTTLCLPVFRRTSLEFGKRLVSARILDVPEDVFHLKLTELERVVGQLPLPVDLAEELRAAVLRRKEARARLQDIPLVDPRLFPPSTLGGDVLLSGMSGSPGVAAGPARIVRNSSEFDRLVPGDVLVAPYTNPSWTPLFQRAAAVIVDSGSPASHAAIVAREYGIPAVMGTANGTRRLVDGQQVRVDADHGLVLRAS